jgi:isoquinoline 1-oxidoreductase beta subunit
MGAEATHQFSRRFVLIAAGSTGLVLGFSTLANCSRSDVASAPGELNAWISIAPDNTVTVRVVNMDMGQGAQTGLAQIAAEELDADWSTVRVEMAPVTDSYTGSDGSGYYTGGSGSIRRHFDAFRQAGATARAMLVAAAAKRWSVDPVNCSAENSRIMHTPSKRSVSYGEVAQAAGQLPVPTNIPLKPRAKWSLIGKPVHRLDLFDKVNGGAIYGIDTKVEGMLVGTVVQCPFFDGKLESVDEKPALAVKGVRQVVKLDNAVAVVASDFWTAKNGLDALAPHWQRAADPIVSDEAMFARLRSEVGAADSDVASLPADKDTAIQRVASAFRSAHKIVEAEYELPLLAHAPIEPMNAIARVSAAACELWAPMQDQSAMRDDLASTLGLPKNAITLHTTKTGGGFGRRLKTDYGVLAARVAKVVGHPVKLIWTREEDFAHDFYRPASVCHLRAALDENMMIRAIESAGATANDTAIGGLGGSYGIDLVTRQKNTKLAVPIGAWRSVDASITVFCLESLIDEVALAVGDDPLAYRRRLLAGKPRELRVLNTVAEIANWGHPPVGHFQGLAYFHGTSWQTSVAEIVELSVDAVNKITVHRIFCAIDCGTPVNPDAVAAQTQGGIVLGLSAALGEAITIKDGRVEQTNFDAYQVLRMYQVPDIEVRVLETPDVPVGGVGEPPVPPIAPAVANALFKATGKRIRTLPFAKSGFTA